MDNNIITIEVSNIICDVLDRRNTDYVDPIDWTDLRDDEINVIVHWLMKRDKMSCDYILEADLAKLRDLTILTNDLLKADSVTTYDLIKADLAELMESIAVDYYKSEIIDLIFDLEPTVRADLRTQYEIDIEC